MGILSKNSLLKFAFGLICLVSPTLHANTRLVNTSEPKIQNHSWSKPNELVVSSMDLALSVDMEAKKIHGLVSHQIVKVGKGKKKSKFCKTLWMFYILKNLYG